MTLSYTHEEGKRTAETQDVRVTAPTLVNTPDLSASYVQFWTPHFKGLPVEERIRQGSG